MTVISSSDVLAVILGGGRGTRLHPLTAKRSKPAVPIAGKYRLIDVPISNCIHSGIYRIAVLTQFNSVSLHRHINQTYHFDHFHTGWVEILAAEQTPSSSAWYQGTADAVRKQLGEIRASRAKYVLILAGDHLYRMDYRSLIEHHEKTDAQITVAVQPISRADTGRFGVLKRSPNGRITDFAEKPKDPAILQEMVSRRDDPARPFLGSLGFYLFNTDVLVDLLSNAGWSDFGTDIIPASLKTHRVVAYDFDDFWEDIGTIRSFFDTNLALTRPKPVFNFFDAERPIYTHARFLPGSVIEDSVLSRVVQCDGCRIHKAHISDSVVGVRSQIFEGARIRSSIVMGADRYEPDGDGMPMGIGRNCDIEGAIIDKNARLGSNVVIRPFPKDHPDIETESWVMRDGVVVIPKDAIIPDGTHIGPAENLIRSDR